MGSSRGQRGAGWLSLQDLYGRPAYHITAEVSVYVAQDFQTRGIGRRLLEKAIDEAPSLGLMNLVGFVFGHNAANLHLLESLGFQRWGHLPRVTELDGVERDVVILGLRLGVQPGS